MKMKAAGGTMVVMAEAEMAEVGMAEAEMTSAETAAGWKSPSPTKGRDSVDFGFSL